MKRLSSIALLGAFLALGVTACDNDTGPVPGVESVEVSPTEVTINVGESVQLSAQVNTTGEASSDVNWTSSNSSVASVSGDGTVTGAGEGTATVTATSAEDGSKQASAAVTVVTPQPAEITLRSYRAVSSEESQADGPVSNPDSVGTQCCASDDHTILEVEAEVAPGSKELASFDLILSNENMGERVVDSRTITSSDLAAADRVLTHTFTANTQFFDGDLDGRLVTPRTPNGRWTLSLQATFTDGSTKRLDGPSLFIMNEQQVKFSMVELPDNRALGDLSAAGLGAVEFYGGPFDAAAAVTIVDHLGVGVGEVTVFDASGALDLGNGAGAPVTLSTPPYIMPVDHQTNAGVFTVFVPFLTNLQPIVSAGIPDDETTSSITTADGESYVSRGVPIDVSWGEPFLFANATEAKNLSILDNVIDELQDHGFPTASDALIPALLIDYCAPIPTNLTYTAILADGTETDIVDQHFSFGQYSFDDIGLCGVEQFIAEPDNLIFQVDVADTGSGAVHEDVETTDALDERTNTGYEAQVVSLEDPLGNTSDVSGVPPSDDHGVDRGAPEYDDQLPATPGTILRAVPDDRDFMLLFDVADPLLADGNPGSGVDHAESSIAITDAGGTVTAAGPPPTDGGGAGGSEFDQDSDDDGTDGDYHVDVVDLVGEGSYSAVVATEDEAALPNGSELIYESFAVDATPPESEIIDPPARTINSSQSTLTFTIKGESTDNFGLSSVMITVRNPGQPGDACDPGDPLATEGSGPGEVSQNTFDVTAEAQAGERYEREVSVRNDSGNTTHLCFFIEAEDQATQNDGTPAPWTDAEFVHTDINWS